MKTTKLMKWDEIKEVWLNLENENTSPYQVYSFLSGMPLSTSDKDIFRRRHFSQLNITIWDDLTCIMIIPIVIDSGGSICNVKLRGYDNGAGLLGILYSADARYDDFMLGMNACITELKRKYDKVNFLLGRIEDEKLCMWVEKYLEDINYTKKYQKCVAIDASEGYDDWISKLNKNMKQNIRTMYNRLRNDSIQYKIQFHVRQMIDGEEYNAMQRLYSKRIVEKIEHDGIKKYIGRILPKIVYALKKHNGFIKSLNNEKNSFHATILFNNQIVAFMSGVVKNDARIVIPHLCYDTDFKRYSPGILLVCETIKFMASEHFSVLDLSCGAEQYKYTLGASEYSIIEYSFSI